MSKETKAITVLLDLTKKLIELVTLESALKAVTDAALDLLPGEHASIRILDDSGIHLLSGARSGEGVDHSPMTFRRGEGVVGWTASHGCIVRINDTAQDVRFKEGVQQGFPILSILTIPLWSSGKVVGVLGVTSSQENAYSKDDEMMAVLLANCAVPPIERARLQRLMLTDSQTLAYTQNCLFPKLQEEIERSKRDVVPLCILLMDLDHFKAINDQFGHAAGDCALSRFAALVRASIRNTDIFIRRGGEEFVVNMPNTSSANGELAGERIRERLANEIIEVNGHCTLTMTVSIGVVTWNGKESAEELEARADAAMYQAKRNGRNRVEVSRFVEAEE